jgi:hypothetical protein
MWVSRQSPWKQIFYSLFIHLTLLDAIIVLQLFYAMEVKNFLDFTIWMIMLPPSLGIQAESYNYHFNLDKILSMKKMIRECFDEYCVSDSYKKELLKVDKIYKFLLWNIVFLVTTFPLFSAFNRELIMIIWSPLDLSINFNYWIIFMFEVITLSILAPIGLSFDTIPMLFMAYVVILLQQLSERFENLKHIKNDRVESRKQLIKCIKLQVKLHEISKLLNQSFSFAILARGFLSVSVFCTNILAILVISDVIVLGKLASFLFHMLGTVFVVCYYGNKITEYSNRVNDSIFASEWMYQDKEYRQLVKIAMEFNKQPIKISAAIFSINLETFLLICKSAYSMFCFCSNFIGK